MSLGYTGLCKKGLEDENIVIYTYGGENWNDEKSQSGDINLQDGILVINKHDLNLPSTPYKAKRRTVYFPPVMEYVSSGAVAVEKECKNAFIIREDSPITIDYIGYMLLLHILMRYEETAKFPDSECFIQ